MSTNRTIVDLVTSQSILCAEVFDLPLDAPLLRLQACELVARGKGTKVVGNHCADGGSALRGSNACAPIDAVGHGDRNVLHSFTVTQRRAPRAWLGLAVPSRSFSVPGHGSGLAGDLNQASSELAELTSLPGLVESRGRIALPSRQTANAQPAARIPTYIDTDDRSM